MQPAVVDHDDFDGAGDVTPPHGCRDAGLKPPLLSEPCHHRRVRRLERREGYDRSAASPVRRSHGIQGERERSQDGAAEPLPFLQPRHRMPGDVDDEVRAFRGRSAVEGDAVRLQAKPRLPDQREDGVGLGRDELCGAASHAIGDGGQEGAVVRLRVIDSGVVWRLSAGEPDDEREQLRIGP